MSAHPDLLIVGGGVIGLSLADCALREGLRVVVLERGEPAREASWAGAGMLTCRPRPRAIPDQPDYHDLTFYSVTLHKEWAARLLEETGIDVGYRVCGALEVIRPEHEQDAVCMADLAAIVKGSNARGIIARRIGGDEARRLEPSLAADIIGAIEFPNEAQIRNPRFTRALIASIAKRGGEIRRCDVADIDVDGDSRAAKGVVLKDGSRIAAGNVAVCSGAWTAQLPALVRLAPRCAKIEPVRGQMLRYEADANLVRRVISDGKHYIVPRGDGVVLAGATHEHAGFDKNVTEAGYAELVSFTRTTVPALADLKPVQHWAGLRPGLKGRHPVLGPVTGIAGLHVASGHYRNGLTLAPATAQLLTDTLVGRKLKIAIGGWALG